MRLCKWSPQHEVAYENSGLNYDHRLDIVQYAALWLRSLVP
jgi:hypothetical protein